MKHKIAIWSSSSTSRYITKRIEDRLSKRYLYTVFKATLFTMAKSNPGPSKDEWITKTDFIRTREYYSALKKKKEKKGNSDTWYNRDEPWEHFAKWNKPDRHRRQTLYDFTSMKCLELSRRQKVEGWLLEAVGRERERCCWTRTELQFCKVEGVLETGHTVMWMHLAPWSCTW